MSKLQQELTPDEENRLLDALGISPPKRSMTTTDQLKYTKALERARLWAHMPDSLVPPEDVERMTPEQVYDWLEDSCNLAWNKDTEMWEYDG